ncbi:MAG: DUF922 domain-containing protein [Hyphomicrobiales bacterium]|nr:MAG: DUF922 domain-containing protein [Hyphomicrobiales bacterium]
MRTLVTCLAVLSAIGTGAQAGVTEAVVRKPYRVQGNSAAEVRADLKAKGPDGWDGYTYWHVDWRYVYKPADAGCGIREVATQLTITFTMPSLETDNSVLKAAFDDYLTRLQVHEDGHAENGREAARRIDAGIAALTAATCEELGRVANAFGHRIVAETAAADKTYDAATGHGRTQGAVFPKPLEVGSIGPQSPDIAEADASSSCAAPAYEGNECSSSTTGF